MPAPRKTQPRLAAVAMLIAMFAGDAAASPLRRVPLGHAELAATAQGRMNLKYLSYCALDADTVLVARHGKRRFEYRGRFGLAPRWHEAALDASEAQLVSGCMLALRNYYGAKVPVSLHLPSSSKPSVGTALQSLEGQYPVREGRYFGNLFAEQPRAYVCSLRWTAEQRTWLEARKRVCALPGREVDAQGRSITPCGFVHVGECAEEAFTQDGAHYESSVQVFLQEDAPMPTK